jgi:hypothetical protein
MIIEGYPVEYSLYALISSGKYTLKRLLSSSAPRNSPQAHCPRNELGIKNYIISWEIMSSRSDYS